MKVIQLNSDGAEEFIKRQPVAVILFFTPGDHRTDLILAGFAAVAESFAEYVCFGTVDLTATENAEILSKGVITLTPTVIYYRFGEPCGEDIGYIEITKWLTHDNIVHRYGRMDVSWIKLFQ